MGRIDQCPGKRRQANRLSGETTEMDTDVRKVVEIDSGAAILISIRNRNLGRVKDACGDEGGNGNALTFKVRQLHGKKLVQ